MLRNILATIFNPRFRRYLRAKRNFEQFCIDLNIAADGPTEEQQQNARNDLKMREAETDFAAIAKQCEQLGDFLNSAASRYELGMLYNLQGKSPEALGTLISALESLNNRYGGPPDPSRPWALYVDSKLPKMDRHSKVLLSGCRFEIGLAYFRSKDYQHAREEFLKSLEIDRAIADIQGQRLCEIGLQKCDEAANNPNTA